MFKKIQQYLLIHHPLLWNIRIVPILCSTILANLLFAATGYSITTIDFSSYYSETFLNNSFIYFGSAVSAMLFFIFWMITYSKNNAFNTFYPKSTKHLYLEWIFIFIIVFSMISFPYSFYQGINYKIKSYATEKEVEEAVKVLKIVDILIPESKTDYFKEYPNGEEHVYSPKNATYSNDSIYTSPTDRTIQEAEEEKETFPHHPNFIQLSLLNYSGNGRLYIPERYGVKTLNHANVIDWLKNNEKEKIRKLMDDFFALHSKHGLKTNLTADKWMELIYNPEEYPVGDFNLISRYNPYQTPNRYYYPRERKSHDYYLQYSELTNNYKNILEAYKDKEKGSYFLLTSICLAIGISLLVFSFRVSSGKTWLTAFVSMGVILVLNTLFSFIFGISISGIASSVIYTVILLGIFVTELTLITNKIMNNKSKGYSGVMINHVIGFIPIVPILLFTLIYIVSNETCDYRSDNCIYKFMSKYAYEFMWGNVCLTFISMWLFVRFVLLKWKSLPEQ